MIAASAGNHALGLAYHGQLLGIRVTVVMPRFAPLVKVTTCRKLGAKSSSKAIRSPKPNTMPASWPRNRDKRLSMVSTIRPSSPGRARLDWKCWSKFQVPMPLWCPSVAVG